MQEKRFGSLSSSYNPENLALTVRGILTGLLPAILILVNAAGWADTLDEGTLKQLIEAVVNLISIGGGLLAAVMTGWGILRKIFIGLGWVQSRR